MEEEVIYLRPAVLEDKDLLYQWRIDVVCRKNSVTPDKSSYDNHSAWFLDRLRSDESYIFICMKKDIPVGQVRVDYQDGTGRISYSVSTEYRGEGYGTQMLELLEHEATIREKTLKLFGIVKYDNKASQRCFEKLRYSKEYRDGCFYYSKVL